VKQNNVINLSDYREEKEEEHRKSLPPQYIQDFEVGGYYVYPELGVMIHCMLITDSSHTHNNELMYIMEDQFGNLLSVPIDDPDSMMGWRSLEKEVFTEIVKKGLSEPEPPRVG
tara:strand:+ start:161 stop:502 length:342 start_codon:yes stop_codon:yes gene_type:complete